MTQAKKPINCDNREKTNAFVKATDFDRTASMRREGKRERERERKEKKRRDNSWATNLAVMPDCTELSGAIFKG